MIVAALLFRARSFIIKLAPEKVRPVGAVNAGGPFVFLMSFFFARVLPERGAVKMPHGTSRPGVPAVEPGYLDRRQAVYRVAIGQRANAQLQPDVAASAHTLRDAIGHQAISQCTRYPSRAVAASVP